MLGDLVKDTVSGFTGIATARHSYLNGCDRISIQPLVSKKEMKLPDSCTFDEPQLIILKKGVHAPKVVVAKTGWPEKYVDKGRTIG